MFTWCSACGRIPTSSSLIAASRSESVICLLSDNKSWQLSPPSLWRYQGTKTRLFIFISVIISPQQPSHSSTPAPLSPPGWSLTICGNMAGGSPDSWKLQKTTVAVLDLGAGNLFMQNYANKSTQYEDGLDLNLFLWEHLSLKRGFMKTWFEKCS